MGQRTTIEPIRKLLAFTNRDAIPRHFETLDHHEDKNMLNKGWTIITALGLLLPLTASATGSFEFASKTRLSGAQEVPGNDSAGRSTATIRFSRDFSSATVRVRFSALAGEVTRLHLHCNVAGANGPVAIGLIDTINTALDNSDNIFLSGHRISGTITNVDFADNDCVDVVGRPVNNIASLAAAIEAGLIYWNLHTTAFPPGELRGQVRPLVATEDDLDD